MEKPIINYETLIRITKAISVTRDPEESVLVPVEAVTHALKVKGCAFVCGSTPPSLGSLPSTTSILSRRWPSWSAWLWKCAV